MSHILISCLILLLGYPNHMAEAATLNVFYVLFYAVSIRTHRKPLTKRRSNPLSLR